MAELRAKLYVKSRKWALKERRRAPKGKYQQEMANGYITLSSLLKLQLSSVAGETRSIIIRHAIR